MLGSLMQYTCWDWGVAFKPSYIGHRKNICFESTTSLLRKLTRDFLFLFFLNCVMEDTLINFWGVILIETAPKRRILCVRETLKE